MERLGARLFGHWRGHPFNSNWPEVTTIWEIDGMRHFGSLSEARIGRGENSEHFKEWDHVLEQMGATGEGRLCSANDDIKPIEQLKAENFNAAAVLQENMTTKGAMQREYLEQLKKLYAPWSVCKGN